jgi:hypothetical protein
MVESFISKKGQLGYKYIVLGRDMLYLFNKTHSESNKYISSINKMPMILINNICVIIGARVC